MRSAKTLLLTLTLLSSCSLRRLTLNPPVLPDDAKLHSCWAGQDVGVVHCNYTSGGSDHFKLSTMGYGQAVRLLNSDLEARRMEK